ncbi:peptidoglycan-associated lipoprotein Pal [Cognatishimia sp. SS12]|uniref:peptidoglycan-associated lipoprotein Pal n=1 Tax=Cognatishimia sp. SS12 TaxID=2979465 RepID=UPI00232DAB26|nr:peptidoglycan-associated lipoprotein Pal [Cognatishimia sp. SS12]MDC0738779.1 peptidoglycan-associated lipoprotein Pal [Cognatishimia sp. SS12]
MRAITKSAALCAIVALAACTNPNSAGQGGLFGGNSGAAGDVVPGSANDPRSPAYFQQAIGDRVLFPVDQSTLTDEGRAVLTAQAGWLMTNSDYLAVIEGHADEQGTREYNLALGARRANAVREYLIEQGVAGNRLKTLSYGKERPIEICSLEACYAQNRRAVTIISAGLTS